MPPLDHGTPGGCSWTNCVWLLGAPFQILRFVSPTGGRPPERLFPWNQEPAFAVSHGGRAADGRFLGKFVHMVHFVLSIFYCIYYILYFLLHRTLPSVPTSVEWRVDKPTCGYSLGRSILYFVLCILYLVFSITTGLAHCASICSVTCGQTGQGCSFGKPVHIVCFILRVFYCNLASRFARLHSVIVNSLIVGYHFA